MRAIQILHSRQPHPFVNPKFALKRITSLCNVFKTVAQHELKMYVHNSSLGYRLGLGILIPYRTT